MEPLILHGLFDSQKTLGLRNQLGICTVSDAVAMIMMERIIIPMAARKLYHILEMPTVYGSI